MKTRRLCAVIAAAATLLGGMAFGTAGAYAAGSASIEVRHSQKGAYLLRVQVRLSDGGR